MREISNQALNNVNIVGKLLNVSFGSGTLSTDGRHYERATVTVRVNQKIGEVSEIDEIQASFFAAQFTKGNKPNPVYEAIQQLKTMKTAESVGIELADTVRLSRVNIQENSFVNRNGQFSNGWQLRAAFIGKPGEKFTEIASFATDIFILDMHDEIDSYGETTGRLIVKGGIVQYGGTLDVVEFVVEAPDKIDYFQRTFDVNQTAKVSGRIRVTSREVQNQVSADSWGEVFEENSTRLVKELVITGGNVEPYDEDFSYDPVDIKKAFNVRKAKIEQMQLDATKPAAQKKATPKYDWE